MLYSLTVSNTQIAISRAIAVQLARTNRTQAWLADAVKLTPTSLSNRMTGRVLWDTDDIYKIAAAFGFDSFEFLRLAEAESRIAA